MKWRHNSPKSIQRNYPAIIVQCEMHRHWTFTGPSLDRHWTVTEPSLDRQWTAHGHQSLVLKYPNKPWTCCYIDRNRNMFPQRISFTSFLLLFYGLYDCKLGHDIKARPNVWFATKSYIMLFLMTITVAFIKIQLKIAIQ